MSLLLLPALHVDDTVECHIAFAHMVVESARPRDRERVGLTLLTGRQEADVIYLRAVRMKVKGVGQDFVAYPDAAKASGAVA